MITIIHGDDVVSSRNFFLEEKRKSTSSPIVDAATLELPYLVQMLEGTSLLSDNKNLFIEYFFSKVSSKMSDDIASYLNRVHKNGHIVFWEPNEIGKKKIILFKNPTIKTFKLPKALFAFLESIRPRGNNHTYFHQALVTTEPELLFYMIVRQFRLLIAILSGSKKSIDEVTRLAPWQRARLTQQARFFTLGSLKRNYEELFAIELAHKTGKSPLSLTQSIDFFLGGL